MKFPTFMHQDRTLAPEHLLVVRIKDIKSDPIIYLVRLLKLMKHELGTKGAGLIPTQV